MDLQAEELLVHGMSREERGNQFPADRRLGHVGHQLDTSKAATAQGHLKRPHTRTQKYTLCKAPAKQRQPEKPDWTPTGHRRGEQHGTTESATRTPGQQTRGTTNSTETQPGHHNTSGTPGCHCGIIGHRNDRIGPHNTATHCTKQDTNQDTIVVVPGTLPGTGPIGVS